MTAAALVARLRGLCVELWFEGERLRFRAPKDTLTAELRSQLSAQRREVVSYLRAEAAARPSVHPLSYSQRALWFFDQQVPGSAAYHIAVPALVRSPLDDSALRQAAQALMDRHPALRTTYSIEGDVPCQRVAGDAPATVSATLVPTLDDAALKRMVEADLRRPFDLEEGPVFRVHLYTRKAAEHVLVLAAHHIAADGWSLLTLLDEFLTLYDEAATGTPTRLPRITTSYTDYALWQEEMLAGPEGERLWTYWRDKLAAPRTPLNLPVDRPRPDIRGFHGAATRIPLDRSLSDKMRDLALRQRTTPFVVWLAAYQAFLFRLTGAEDIIVGSPTFGRSKPAYLPVIGDFVNSVPLRARPTAAMTFTDLVAQVRTVVLEALDAQEFPLSLMVQRLQPDRDSSGSPLFNTFFVLHRFERYAALQTLTLDAISERPIEFGGLRLTPYPVEVTTTQFDLSVQMVEVEGTVRGELWYATDIFDAATVGRFAADYASVVAALADRPGMTLGELPALTRRAPVETLLAELDARQIRASLEGGRLRLSAPKGAFDDALKAAVAARRDDLIAALARADPIASAGSLGHWAEDWNDTALDHDRSRCLHHLLELSARDTPESPAVIAEVSLTYRDLDERANRLAHLLQARGVGAGDRVAVCLDRSVDIPVAIAAVLKLGAAYVPLDPTHPRDRLGFILSDAGVACVVTVGAFAALLGGAAPVVALDAVEAELGAQPAHSPGIQVSPDALAYVIYTSGSTGMPKGVQVEHRNVVAFLEAMRREPGMTARDTVLAVTTLSFDIAGLEFWLPLSVGAKVVIATHADAIDGERLIELLDLHDVSLLQATPATWRLMLDAGWTGRQRLKALCGGEALPPSLARSLIDKVGELWNMYGPTETTIWSTMARVSHPEAPISIGRPIANTRVYLLDPAGNPSPIGVPGELCIGGEGVARGYLNRPELTAERFVPFVRPDGQVERIYRTGDMARWLADGRLEYRGRRDFQVKVRGHRIELGEIEAILATCPGVRECVVVAGEDQFGEQRLVGYVTLLSDAAFQPGEARALLGRKLPDYMIPGLFSVLPALPLTPNGKVDRLALPLPEAPARPIRLGSDALMTAAQRRVAALWREMLHADRIGLHDNFFEVGGHSLLLVKLHAGLKREFGSSVPLVELFQCTTVATQADRFSSLPTPDRIVRLAQARAARQADANAGCDAP